MDCTERNLKVGTWNIQAAADYGGSSLECQAFVQLSKWLNDWRSGVVGETAGELLALF
jgi:hypothetical protein